MDIMDAVQDVRDAVFQITDKEKTQMQATGFLLDNETAITCAHCVNENFDLFATFPNGNQYPIQIQHQNKEKDLASLKLKDTNSVSLEASDHNQINLGEELFTLGYPLNTDNLTFLSAHFAGYEELHYPFQVLKLDCSVNHGNSGGPLFNSQGEVIGVINAKHGGVSKILQELEESDRGSGILNVGGVDPIEEIKKLIREMRRNLNLGIGYAIPIRESNTLINL